MEIPEAQFYKQLLQYFRKRYQECMGWDADAVKSVISGLEELVSMTKPPYDGRKNIKVHIGKLFGFKIK